MGQDESIAVTEKQAAGLGKMTGGVLDVGEHRFLGNDGEPFFLVHAAKSALVVRTTNGYLEQNAGGFTGRTINYSLIVHGL